MKYEKNHEKVESGEKPNKLNFSLVESHEQVFQQNPNGEQEKNQFIVLNFAIILKCDVKTFLAIRDFADSVHAQVIYSTRSTERLIVTCKPVERDLDLNIDQIKCWKCSTINSKYNDVCRSCGEFLSQ